MKIFLEGFLLQASLILALGAQNLFILESGLKKQRNLIAALVCSVCDALLIAVGVFGAASVFVQIPALKLFFGVAGVAFLFYYGVKKVMEGIAFKPPEVTSSATTTSLKKVIFLSLSFSLLNPHVYLDTVVLIGGYSSKFAEITERGVFGTGAATFSALWFFGLSVFAFFLGNILKSPKAMKGISVGSGIILIVLGFKLGYDVYLWIR